jgi:Uma2 family endonuclease
MSHSAVLAPILHSPSLPLLLEELNQFWADEQKRRLEFYDWVTPEMKAEFIDGEIVIHSPVRSRHNVTLINLVVDVKLFLRKIKKGYLGVEKIMTRFTRNDYEPDLCYFREEKSKNFKDDQTIFPTPDFVVEILSAATADRDRDRDVKFKDYEAHGVEEYWIIDPDLGIVEQYILQKKGKKQSYSLEFKGDSGMLKSVVLEGFEIDIETLFEE